MDKRQCPRFSFKESIAYQTAQEVPLAGSLSADISQGGVRIRIQEFIALRTVVHLKIHLTNPARVVPVKGEVVWVREVPHSESYDVGIRFLEATHLMFNVERSQ
ncbi:MAG: PilZ domain-containing protein [Candidatus Omnitrophica bacterium]|nr:PilZ domain-containing protein [Candidatus Omnitrophota bacterium]